LSILPVYPLVSPETTYYYGNTPYNQPDYPWPVFPPYAGNNSTISTHPPRYPQPRGYFQPYLGGVVESVNYHQHPPYPNMQQMVPYFPHHYHQYQTAQATVHHNEAPEVAEHSVFPDMPSATTDSLKTILDELNTVCRKNEICNKTEELTPEVSPDIPTDELRDQTSSKHESLLITNQCLC
jgi:hypothetical protein